MKSNPPRKMTRPKITTICINNFFFDENLNLGAKPDWYTGDIPVLEAFSTDFKKTFLNYDIYGHRHSPIYLIFLGFLKSIGLDFDLIRFIHPKIISMDHDVLSYESSQPIEIGMQFAYETVIYETLNHDLAYAKDVAIDFDHGIIRSISIIMLIRSDRTNTSIIVYSKCFQKSIISGATIGHGINIS